MKFLTGRLIFIIILAIIFLVFFGYPSLLDYESYKTLISEAKVRFKVKEPPAITIAVMTKKDDVMKHGWKDDSFEGESYENVIGIFCNTSESLNKTLRCINDKTYDLADIVENAQSGDHKPNGHLFWNEDISHFLYGKLYTLSSGYEMGTNWFNSLNLTLNNTYKYCV